MVALGRVVNHDPRSLNFQHPAGVPQLRRKMHHRYTPILDQGNLGSCTGNAAVGCLGYKPFFGTKSPHIDEDFARKVYSLGTHMDPFPGEWPPEDTGSSGLGVAKAVKSLNLISGYLHCTSLEAVLNALQRTPLITGTNWYDGMFDTDSKGMVTIHGDLAGGHEYVVDGYDLDRNYIRFRNSWGSSWGRSGRFWMSLETYDRLLHEDGDATVFLPL